MILREWNFSNRDQPTLTFPFDLRNWLLETVVDSGYPVARSWEKRGTKVSRWIWNSHFVSSLFPSLCTPNPTQSFPFNPNVSTFSSRGRIQRDWNHDSLALPFYLLMPSSEWRPSGTIVIPSPAREVRSPPLLVNANSIGDSRRGIMARSRRDFRGEQAILGGKGNTLLRQLYRVPVIKIGKNLYRSNSEGNNFCSTSERRLEARNLSLWNALSFVPIRLAIREISSREEKVIFRRSLRARLNFIEIRKTLNRYNLEDSNFRSTSERSLETRNLPLWNPFWFIPIRFPVPEISSREGEDNF